MSLEQAIKDRLRAVTADDDEATQTAISQLTALVGTRIRPLEGAQNEPRPFLRYTITGDDPINTMQGASAYSHATIEIGILAESYKTCGTVSRLIKALLNGKAFTVATARVAPSTFEDESDVEQAKEPGTEQLVYIRTQTYRMLYRLI